MSTNQSTLAVHQWSPGVHPGVPHPLQKSVSFDLSKNDSVTFAVDAALENGWEGHDPAATRDMNGHGEDQQNRHAPDLGDRYRRL